MTTTLHITEKANNSLHMLGLPTRKQEFGSNHITAYPTAKHMLFYLLGLYRQDN